jgi:DNA-binding MarR family transcriptional regulator
LSTNSSHNQRAALEELLNQAVQRNGNQTVLFTNAISRQIGLNAIEFECYSLLLYEGPLTAGQLANKSGLSTGGVTGLINRLEAAHLATRTRDPADKRRVIVKAIANHAVQQKLMALYEPVGQEFTALLQHYSDQELRTILAFMDQSNAIVMRIMDTLNGQDQVTPEGSD